MKEIKSSTICHWIPFARLFPKMFLFLNFDHIKKVKNESLQIVMLNSLKEASWCTDCNAKKPELILMNHFWKNETCKNIQKSWIFFFLNFWWFLTKLIMFIGWLNAFVKRHDPLIPIQQKLAMCYVPFWKKMGKTVKKGWFLWDFLDGQVEMVHRNEFWFVALQSVHQD